MKDCSNPLFAMKRFVSAYTAILAMTLAANAAPRLVVSTASLLPDSEIDLVLDAAAVAPSDLGKTVENTWMEISPALPGKLTWKAPNIARFVPDGTPQIGTTYRFSIPEGLTHLDETPVPAGEFATSSTDAFRVVNANSPNRWSEDYIVSTAPWIVVFNDDIDPSTAPQFISFSSKEGKQIAARVQHATVKDAGYYGAHYRPWGKPAPENPGSTPDPESTATHVLHVVPETPLPVGEGWGLDIANGLPNQAAKVKTVEAFRYEIGTIQPFTATNIFTQVIADEPRKIVLNFNQAAPELLPENFLTENLQIHPRPENLSATVSGKRIELSGNFSSDRYQVSISPPFKSRGGLELSAALKKDLVFRRLEPELTLPSDNQAQLANGTRTYRIHTVNVSKVIVRVKHLSGPDLIRTYQGYRHYTGVGHDGENISPTAPLPSSLIVGKTILEKEFELDNGIDTSRELTLKWDELLPAEYRNAALFLDITGIPHPQAGSSSKRNAQAILQLTDIGLAWKLTGKSAFLYAFSCDTGLPLPGVKLESFGEDAAAMESVTTDASGLATLPRPDSVRHLRAALGGDTYVTAFDATLSTVGLWHFPIRYSWAPPLESIREAFLFSDRSLYRPGETVRVKGIVRTREGNAIKAETNTAMRLVVVAPDDREIHSSDITLSSTGSFDFTYKLPAERTGTHEIRLEQPDELAEAAGLEDDWYKRQAILQSARFTLPVRVEEFRRNAFEVTQNIATPETGAKQVSTELKAKYYQGQPVAAGKARYFTRITARNPYPERFRDYLFGNHRRDDWGYWYHYFGYRGDNGHGQNDTQQMQGEEQLSPEGTLTFATDLPETNFPTSREVTVSTEVTDANNQTLTSTATTTVHPASLYVGVSRIDKLVRAGDKLPLTLVATNTLGEPYAGAVKVTATLIREVNTTVKSRESGGATTTQNDVTEETVITSEVTLDPNQSAGSGTNFEVTPKATGKHYLTVTGQDAEGRKFATVVSFHVYGTDEYPWLYEDGMRVKMVAEKKSYKPGETARVLVLTPIEGTALVTIEREKILRSFIVELKANQPVIEIPLSDEDAPNAFVSVLIVKGAKDSSREYKQPQLRLGYCELTVEPVKEALAISLNTEGVQPGTDGLVYYRPGDEVILTGKVAKADGTPANGAEVTLYAEDEGTLAVMGYETPRPIGYFYKPRTLDIETGTSFDTFIPEDPETQSFHNKGFFIGGGGDEAPLTDSLRKNFDPCATWAPALIADAEGRFTHRFRVPDTLTRYRVIAVAHEGVTRFGNTETAIVVKKELMLEPKTPRFANQGDTFNAQVLVQNASNQGGTWEIRYEATGEESTAPVSATAAPTAQITLAAGASGTVIFPSKAENTGEAVLRWSAIPVSLDGASLTDPLKRQLSDSVETRFNVEYPMPLQRQNKMIKVAAAGSLRNLRDDLDENLLEGTGRIELEFSQSPLVEAAGSIDFLLTYPYGCLEQTTSSLMPWLAVEDLRPVIPKLAEYPKEKVQEAIQSGVNRLLSMQLADGSFSYWPGSRDTVDWATAYAGMGLVMAAEKGADVPQSAIDGVTKHLIESLRGISEEKTAYGLEMHARTLLTLSIAGSPQPSYRNILVDRIGELNLSARSLLATATALEEKGNAENLAAAKSILESKVPFKLKDNDWMPWKASDAYQVIAWLTISPQGDEAMKALDRMLNDRNPYGHWRTTWANGWSLLAMANFAKVQGTDHGITSVTLETIQGTETITLDKQHPTSLRSFPIQPGMKLNVAADQNAYIRIKVAAKPKIAPIQPVAKNGISVDRVHELVHPDGTISPLTQPKVGDLVRVSLKVTLPSDDTRYLVIEDLLPSIFETVNSDFESQKAAGGPRTSENDWNVSHSELRTDRACFFLDHVYRKGTYTLTYLARCTVAGVAMAPPAKVESMYDPENFAISASREFTAN